MSGTRPSGGTTRRVLVAQPERRLAAFIEVNLRLAGLGVERVADGWAALRAARAQPPDAVVVDVALPDMDRLGLVARLRQEARTRQAAVLVTSGGGLRAEQLLGLAAGADDYLLHPFSAQELRTRLWAALHRVEELRETSPLTGLPGNQRILEELHARVGAGAAVGVAHADITDFKSFNDRYGLPRGDGVISLAGEVLGEAVAQRAPESGFVGHIGGDDFVLISHADAIPGVCEQTVAEFDARVPGLYDAEDAAAGVLELPDRRGVVRRFPLVSIALGVATTRTRRVEDPRELLTIAAEMKAYVRQQRGGSGYAVDARTDDGRDARSAAGSGAGGARGGQADRADRGTATRRRPRRGWGRGLRRRKR